MIGEEHAGPVTRYLRRRETERGGGLERLVLQFSDLVRELRPRLNDIFGIPSDLMTDTAEPRVRFLVSGRVQGVGYRAWVLHRALELGVRGWVRNCRDGSVEVEIAGPPEARGQLRQLLGDGPPLAHVFQITEEPPRGSPLADHFEIR